MDFEVSSQLVVYLVKKYILRVILLSILIGAGMSYVSVITENSVYNSSAELIQNDNNASLISSYQQFVTSKKFKKTLNNEIQESPWKNHSHNQDFSVQIVASKNDNTPFFTLNTTSKNKYFSKFLTNKSTEILISSIGKYLSGSNITVVSRASDGQKQSIKSRIIKWFVYGFVGAFILSSIIYIFNFMFIGRNIKDDFITIVFKEKKLGTIEIPQAKK